MNERPVLSHYIRSEFKLYLLENPEKLTIHRPVTCDSHHATRAIIRLAKVNTVLCEPLLVLGGSDSALDPARCDVVDSDALFPTVAADGSHESTQAVLGHCVLPVALNVGCQCLAGWS